MVMETVPVAAVSVASDTTGTVKVAVPAMLPAVTVNWQPLMSEVPSDFR